MNDPHPVTFAEWLASSAEKGGFETDDVLSSVLPLMRQALAAHGEGRVAPLEGVKQLTIDGTGQLGFAPDAAREPRKNSPRIESLQASDQGAIEVVAQTRNTTDVDEGSQSVTDLSVGSAGQEITQPVYLPGHRSWEHAVGHHDELTDIFSLGMLLASLACGLDFADTDDLTTFARHRRNLFAVNRRINPVLASTIVQMTELNRHRRAPDLAQLISRLVHYRDQPADLDFNRLKGFQESGASGRRRMIQSHLRDRLFEISRRNRLIHFKPSLQSLNLTIASVPLRLDYRNIRLEQLFVWHPELAAAITGGSPMSLGKYLRFEDAPYIAGVLDKIISEARRDRAEFGFAQLRLVICFLHWNNLKESPGERIHSPLLLLPVELSKKKGVRDSYVLDPTTSEAEVNPALRHHLRELYNLELPEFIDLKETSLDQFHESLKVRIQASEPGVTLNKIDRPRIELIHEKARQRVDQFQRRQRVKARRARETAKPEYSYDRENHRPLGLQLFVDKVRPAPIPLSYAAGAPAPPRHPQIVETRPAEAAGGVLETADQRYAHADATDTNPYSWDFDLCTQTIGNFNYRKMTLVQDYAKLIETDMASGAFDAVFSLAPRPAEDTAPEPLDPAEQHLVIPCDATQASAIARARNGASYIIQGPPGTGKSQTITNLIADYVARGKRVLFVCEKRAAIDVVFHRLRQQGLDELCCLIHDSQTDKKAFIQNLRQTYEKFLGPSESDASAARARETTLQSMDQILAALQRFSDVMRRAGTHTGVGVRSLLHRLVELRDAALELPAATDDLLPHYPVWLAHGEIINRLQAAMADLGEDPCFARHPLRWLAVEILEADRPLEALSTRLDRAEEMLDAIESALELSGLPGELWDTFEEIQAILEFAVRARPLAERSLLGVLIPGATAQDFGRQSAGLDSAAQTLQATREKIGSWRDPLGPEDTENAVALARQFAGSFLRFLQPAFWRLRSTLQARYDFSRHAVAPAWTKILEELAAFHRADAQWRAAQAHAAQVWHVDDVEAFRAQVAGLQADPRTAHPSVKFLLEQIAGTGEAAAFIGALANIHDRFAELDATLQGLLHGHDQLDFPELGGVLSQLRGQAGLLAELSPVLAELAALPETLGHALRRAPLPLGDFEAAIGHKSISSVYREDRAVNRFDGRFLARRMEQLRGLHADWLGLNARCLRLGVRSRFMEHVNLAALPASQLTPEQKAFKKEYVSGRRDLEHEFGKTMRYKSIRDLAAGDTGQVIRDLKPVWLMSPLSVSDTLPLDPGLFDVVIFDEASQIPVEEAIPALYRSHQAIVVGDEMQLPPTTFFAAARTDEESVVVEEQGERIEVDLDSDSFLTQSALNLPSTLLAWHYRSRYEALISFSNAAFYGGNLFTIPDRQFAVSGRAPLRIQSPDQAPGNIEALLRRSLSFHWMEKAVYEDRRNPQEAAYIAQLVRGLLVSESGHSIGVVAFSEAQQGEIEAALGRLAEEDAAFSTRLEAECVREENDVFCGLFVKNLENVQGDERDIIILSICYGRDARGRMLMNFGPINQRGGEKRLNVIFSRAKHHMAVVSSIRHGDITNDFNDGANSLKCFLQYAEAVSIGDAALARRILENLNPLSRKSLAAEDTGDAVVARLAAALRQRGHQVDLNVGQSQFRCDLAIRGRAGDVYELGILVDTDRHYANPNLLDRYLMQPAILEAFGWKCLLVLTKDWYHNPADVLSRIEKLLAGEEGEDNSVSADDEDLGKHSPTKPRRNGKGKN